MENEIAQDYLKDLAGIQHLKNDPKYSAIINYLNNGKAAELAKTGKITCECGSKVSEANRIKHLKTKKHQAYLTK